jgi:hypothetical protein
MLPDHVKEDLLTASAQMLHGSAREQYAVQYKTWQDELWAYSRAVGEYSNVMNWFAAGISRMHLTAALIRPGQREPEIIEDENDPAVKLVHRLVTNAKNGETQYLNRWGRQLGVPGVGFFLGYEDERSGVEVFDVKSAKQIRRSTVPFKENGIVMKDQWGEVLTGYDVRTGPLEWRKLPFNQLVSRIFQPDDELDYEVTSWSRGALTTLREIDLMNRHIVATLLSRLVFNGILFIPQEVTFPVNPQFKDAPDPFIAELIAIASRGIKDPGSPASAVPVPLRVPAEFIDKFVHLILANGVDPKLVEARQAAIQNLSQMLPSPPEALTGNSSTNHWNAWKDSEDNVKMYFGPTMEILCGGHNDAFLWPMLKAAGEKIDVDGARRIVWYDASDLIVQPDNSQNAEVARSKGAINDTKYRSALGFDEEDKPSKKEKREMLLEAIVLSGAPAMPEAYYLLYPDEKPDPMDQAVEGAQAQAEANKILMDSMPEGANVGPSGTPGIGTSKTAPERPKSAADRPQAKPGS